MAVDGYQGSCIRISGKAFRPAPPLLLSAKLQYIQLIFGNKEPSGFDLDVGVHG